MRHTNHSAIALLAFVGCVDATDSPSTLRIEPADLTATIVDGQPVVRDYHAFVVDSDGTQHDVTAQTTFSLAAAQYGWWHVTHDDVSLELRGAAVGPTQVYATYDGLSAQSSLTVYAKTTIFDEGVTAAAASMFDSARVDLSCAPTIKYPDAGSLLPRNLDGLAVDWTDSRDDLFDVSLTTTYATVDIYSRGLDPQNLRYTTMVSASGWQQVASSGEPVSLHVRGLVTDSPQVACATYPMRLTPAQPMIGALYYWADGLGIWRHDVATRGEAEPLSSGFAATTAPALAELVPGTCLGCAVSRDGARLALHLDSGEDAIIDLGRDEMMTPTSTMQWQWATFTRGADKLIVSDGTALQLIDDHGQALADIPSTPRTDAFDPQLSPSGTMLANVEYSTAAGASIVVRSFAEYEGNTFGDTRVLVPGVAGVTNYFPSWSPDGTWIAYTRASGWATASPTASIWVVKADGSQAPIQMVAPSADIEMAARWVPSEQTSDGSRFWYLTFDSRRPFGNRTVDTRQMWAMPFFPELGLARPAFHLPFQSTLMNNHVGQWAQALVR